MIFPINVGANEIPSLGSLISTELNFELEFPRLEINLAHSGATDKKDIFGCLCCQMIYSLRLANLETIGNAWS